MPKKQRSTEYTDEEARAAVNSMSNKEAANLLSAAVNSMSKKEVANSLRAAQMAEEDARARAEARAAARAAAREEKFLKNKFGFDKFEDVYNDMEAREPDRMLTLSDMNTEFQEEILPEILHSEASRAARALKKLKGLPSGKAWLSGITKSPYNASIKKSKNPGSSRAASGRKLYKTRNKKSRRGKRTKRARNTRKARR